MLGTMALVGIPMRIFLGWWGDKVSKAKLIATGVFVGAAALMGLQYATDLWQLWVFVLVFAFMQAIIPLNWALIGDLFGRRNYGTLRGVMSIIYTTGTMGMPVFAGYVFDTTQEHNDIPAVMADVARAGIEIKDLATKQSSLEEIFVSLVSEKK